MVLLLRWAPLRNWIGVILCKLLFLIPFCIGCFLARWTALFCVHWFDLILIFYIETWLSKHDICLLIKDKMVIIINADIFALRKFLMFAIKIATATTLCLSLSFLKLLHLLIFSLDFFCTLVTGLVVFSRKKDKNDEWELKGENQEENTDKLILVCNHTPNSEKMWRYCCCFCWSVCNHFW